MPVAAPTTCETSTPRTASQLSLGARTGRLASAACARAGAFSAGARPASIRPAAGRASANRATRAAALLLYEAIWSPPVRRSCAFRTAVRMSNRSDIREDGVVGTDAQQARLSIRRGEWTGPTAGLAPGFTQANLVILPADDAFDFMRFCQRNPKPCPLLEVTDPGSPEPAETAPGADLRTDVPRYRVYREGEFDGEPGDVVDEWRDDLVAFLIGCSFTFERALLANGLPVLHV